jgi:hypothetical protein
MTVFEESEANKLYRKLSVESKSQGLSSYTFPMICVASAVGVHLAGYSVYLSIMLALLPSFPILFPYFAIIVAQYFFFPTPPLEDPVRAARRLKTYQSSYPNGWYEFVNYMKVFCHFCHFFFSFHFKF